MRFRPFAGSLREVPPPAPSEVQLWHVPLEPDSGWLAGCEGTLTAAERSRSEGYRFDRDRRRFVLSRGILRVLLAAPLGRAPEELELTYGDSGKPLLAGWPARTFNLSRSGDIAIIAIARARRVGVDVERLREVADAEAIAERHFSAAARERYRRAAIEDRPHAFLRAWTQLEASLKGLGSGLGAADRPADLPPAGWREWSFEEGDYLGTAIAEGVGLRATGWSLSPRRNPFG